MLGQHVRAPRCTSWYAAQRSGLSTSGVGFAVPLESAEQALAANCKVLDLVLGPLDLRLLGLLVHLNPLHLAITADPTGGSLGALFCALAKPGLPTPRR